MIGARIMAAVSERWLPIALELGGKSPIVVFEDADIETAVDCILGGIFFNCGQMRSAPSRLLVDAKIADAVLGRFARAHVRLACREPLPRRNR